MHIHQALRKLRKVETFKQCHAINKRSGTINPDTMVSDTLKYRTTINQKESSIDENIY